MIERGENVELDMKLWKQAWDVMCRVDVMSGDGLGCAEEIAHAFVEKYDLSGWVEVHVDMANDQRKVLFARPNNNNNG